MLPIERLKRLNTKENLWIYILLLLKEKEIYAWRIPSLIEERFNFKPGRITPYRVLYLLEREKFVKSRKEQRRKFYQITLKGKKQLEDAKNFYQDILEKLK